MLSTLAPSTLIRAALRATRKVEKRQLAAYGDEINYRQYVRSVPRLFVFEPLILGFVRERLLAPFAWREPDMDEAADPWGGAKGASSAEGWIDETREAIVQKEEQEELGGYIENIFGVTYLSGVATVVLGYGASIFAY